MGGASMGGANMGGMTMGAHTTLAGGKPGADDLALLANRLESGQDDPGDVRYPLYLINGRPPADPQTLILRAGDVVRLRLINAAADTIFCVFVEGHPLTVVHTDGQPVDPVTTDALVIGMGERYDVLVTARTSGLARIIGVPLGKHGRAQALLRTGPRPGRPPSPTAPFRMPRRIVGYGDLHDGQLVASPSDVVEHRFDLTQIAGRYAWAVGSEVFGKAPPSDSRAAKPCVSCFLRGAMPHPMHLHGHFFRAVNRRGTGLSKDTILVLPHRQLAIEFVADNPGRWAFHCHNVYHQEAGMMREIDIA